MKIELTPKELHVIVITMTNYFINEIDNNPDRIPVEAMEVYRKLCLINFPQKET
jgi:hypothetical protein